MPEGTVGQQGNDGFVPAEESVVLQTLRETLGESQGEPPAPEPEPETLPPEEKEPELEKEPEKKPAEQAFTVFGEDGKTPVTPPKMVFEFKANGKVRQEPLDRLVQFAQFGVYNHEREQALQRAQEETAQEVDSVYAELEQREAAIERLLTDPAYFEAVQERYMQEKTPEREASRAKAEAQQLREKMQQTDAEKQGQQFFESVVFPGIESIMREFPNLEDSEEVAARLALMLEPLRENGRIPLTKHRQVQALIASDLRDWARATNDRRQQRLVKAQTHEQRGKNALAAATSPTSIGAPPQARRERTGPVTIDEVDNDIMTETIRSMRGR